MTAHDGEAQPDSGTARKGWTHNVQAPPLEMPTCPNCFAFDRALACVGTRVTGARRRVRHFRCNVCQCRFRATFYAPAPQKPSTV